MYKTGFDLKTYESLMHEVLTSEGTFKLYPKGRSMWPLLREGRDAVDLVAREPKRYDIILYKRSDGQYVLHRIMKCTAAGYSLCGDHQIVLEHGVQRGQVIGVVEKLYRDEKRIDKGHRGYALYTFIWCRMWLRKGILRGYRYMLKSVYALKGYIH